MRHHSVGLAHIALATIVPFCASGQGTLGKGDYIDNSCMAMRAVVEDGHALASDGKGPYSEAQDETRVQARGAMSIWAWRYTDGLTNKPDPKATAPRVRALQFDLDHPVDGGGGERLGIISDSLGRFHAFWKHEGTTLLTFTRTPVGQTVPSDRVEMWVYANGHQYVLQMGPWSMGLFFTPSGSFRKGNLAGQYSARQQRRMGHFNSQRQLGQTLEVR